jgi:hypothetical protein
MKKAKRIAGVFAFTAILMFTLTAATCGGSKPYASKTGDGVTYTLTVTDTKGKVSANPQEGDTYTLKITYPNKDTLTSGGTITNVNYQDGVLELTQDGEGETIKVTIDSGGDITDINGAITLSGGATAVLSVSEEDLTTVTSGAPPVDPDTIETAEGLGGLLSGIFGGGEKSQSKGGGGSGGFTLTDIPPEYNGKYALLVGMNIASPTVAYVGYQSFDGKGNNQLCYISNGRVSLPIWTVDSSSKIKKYSGSDTLYVVSVSIMESETQAKEDLEPLGMAMFMTVNFSKGNAVQSWEDGMASGDDPMMDMILETMKGALGNPGAR